MTDTIKENILKEIEEKKELFRRWLFEDKTLIDNYSNYFIEYCELKAQLKICDEYEKKIQEFVDILDKFNFANDEGLIDKKAGDL